MFMYCNEERLEGKEVGKSSTRELTFFDFKSGPMIQVEVNLEEAPLFLLKSREREQDSIESRSTVITQGGDRQEQYWKITGSRQFGLPGPLDQDVFGAGGGGVGPARSGAEMPPPAVSLGFLGRLTRTSSWRC